MERNDQRFTFTVNNQIEKSLNCKLRDSSQFNDKQGKTPNVSTNYSKLNFDS